MRVSDVVQHADLSLWPQLALVLFVGAFLIVSIRALRTGKTEASAMAGIPLDDDSSEYGGER